MKTPFKFLCAATLSTLLIGCGRTDTADAEVEETDPSIESAEVDVAEPEPEPDAAAFRQALSNDVDSALKQKNYEAAVDTLGQVNQNWNAMTPQQRLEYEQQLRNATEALLRAKDSDPRAAQAYDQLSRRILGR